MSSSDLDNLIDGLRRQRQRIQQELEATDRDETLAGAVRKLKELRDRAEISSAQDPARRTPPAQGNS